MELNLTEMTPEQIDAAIATLRAGKAEKKKVSARTTAAIAALRGRQQRLTDAYRQRFEALEAQVVALDPTVVISLPFPDENPVTD